MKAVINHDIFLKELKKISTLVKKNNIIPATGCVLLKFGEDTCTIRATDLETVFISEINCNCKNSFSVMVDYENLMGACSVLIAPINFELNNTEITIKSGVSKFKLLSQGDETAFVVLPEDEFDVSFEATGELYYQISKAASVKTKNQDNVNFNMVCLDVDNKDIKVVGVDTASSYIKTVDINSGKSKTVMIPDGFVSLTKTFQESTISIGERYVMAVYKNTTVMGRLSEQKFLNYKTALTKTYDFNLTINRQSLLNGVQAISFALNAFNNTMQFSFSNKGIKIVCVDVNFGNEAETFVECENNVPIEKIGFRVKDFSQMLSAIDGEDVEFSFTDEKKPAYCRPINDNTFLSILAPVSF